MQEERRGVAREARPLGLRIDHTVCRGRQDMIGEALQHVPDVDHQRPGRRIDRQPLSIAMKNLEAALFGA